MPRSHYDVLEVSPSASPEVLRAAYKSLIQRYHPDRNPGDATAAERSTQVVRAYQVLSDPVLRAGYDLELQGLAASRERSPFRPAVPAARPERDESRSLKTLWIAAGLICVALWYFGQTILKPAPTGAELRAPAARPADAKPIDAAAGNQGVSAAAVIPDYIKDVKVALPTLLWKDADGGQHIAKRTLQIKAVGLVAGGSDLDKYIELLRSSHEYVSRKLAEQLAKADYDLLVAADGDRYLKRMILESISDITNAKRPAAGMSAGAAAAHYGVVEVVLPESFAVESDEDGKVTVQIHSAR
jgi:curved DNA-binding protein CbpA